MPIVSVFALPISRPPEESPRREAWIPGLNPVANASLNNTPNRGRSRVLCRLRSSLAVAWLATSGCDRKAGVPSDAAARDPVRGQPIAVASPTNAPGTNAPAPFVPADYSRQDVITGGVIQLGWDKISGFKYDVYEVYSETNAGRALIRSDDTIPAPMKAYDGRIVSVSGFVLPLRTKKGLVTEFLLLRDQGTCCFGPQAQINHFIRGKYPPGFQHDEPIPWRVTGTLRVGEIYIQGYLTGLYQLEAREVTASTATR